MEYEKCYVFPADDAPPAKRRKLESEGLQASWPLRRQLYRDSWAGQQRRIDARLAEINSASVDEIATYLNGSRDTNVTSATRLPTGLVVTGPSATAYTSILDRLSARLKSQGATCYVPINSSAGSNCKALLKLINQKGSSFAETEGDEADDDEAPLSNARGRRLLNYDLQILYDHVRDNSISQVVLAFEDTEAFDAGLLSELLDLLSCWIDRIPFVLLFRIATSAEIFQQRLSKSALKSLNATVFDIAPSSDEIEEVFDVISLCDPEKDIIPKIWLGGNVLDSMIGRQHDYLQTIDVFVGAARYAHMSAFYANALTAFFAPRAEEIVNLSDHVKALRNTDSFRVWAEESLKRGDHAEVRNAIEDDRALVEMARLHLSYGIKAMSEMMKAIDLLQSLQTNIKTQTVSAIQKSRLYVQATTGKLGDSPFVRGLLLTIRKLPSDATLNLLTALLESPKAPLQIKAQLEDFLVGLKNLVSSQNDNNVPLRSEEDMSNSTLRTTVIAKKVELSKHKSALSKQDTAYTAILRSFTDKLESYFSQTLKDPKTLLFNEIFLYDLKSPLRENLTPRPRHAIERALASPHDYLACECCAPEADGGSTDGDGPTLSNTQPATAILYQLYLESGTLINVSDLWQAFQAVLGGEDQSDEESGPTKALFQRSLAELKSLGMVKPTRRKVDHIQKVMWKGL